MYLWKVDRLADELGKNQVSQKEEFKYTLAVTLLGMLLLGLAAFGSGAVPPWLMAADLAIMLAITGAGIVYCYNRNQGSDNRDFIVRFICLGLPVTVRITVLGMVIGFIVGVVAGITLEPASFQQSEAGPGTMVLINLGLGYLIHALYFIYLARWLAAVGDVARNPAG
ncbi:hypothetical protein [Vreelandella utahensis]|uniref:hypothetical protein n=1 Tax=Vreelandella halophila TaxID=86177 RepID=UPI000987C952|nr:hypothetical protein [Halomonas utahensis]